MWRWLQFLRRKLLFGKALSAWDELFMNNAFFNTEVALEASGSGLDCAPFVDEVGFILIHKSVYRRVFFRVVNGHRFGLIAYVLLARPLGVFADPLCAHVRSHMPLWSSLALVRGEWVLGLVVVVFTFRFSLAVYGRGGLVSEVVDLIFEVV